MFTLDEEDYAKLFADLHADFNIVLPPTTVSDISHLPDHPKLRQMTLVQLIDTIYMEMSEKKQGMPRESANRQ